MSVRALQGSEMNFSPIKQRVELLDILRGIAIFGMFAVNMTADLRWADLFGDLQPWSADFASLVFVNLFANGKFITIFSFLFGIGFYVQAERRIANNVSVASFWLRRLSGLLMIGVVANACTLPAWILVDYAIFGLGLLLFYKLPPRKIFIAAITCFVIGTLFGSIIPTYWPPLESGVPMLIDEIHESAESVQRDGSFLEISAWTILHLWEEFADWRYYLNDIAILGLMLLGLYVARRGAIRDREIRLSIAGKASPWLLGIGFFGCAMWVAMKNFGLGDESSVHYSLVMDLLAWPFGMPFLGMGYVAAITLITGREKWKTRLTAFAPIGRMALTNYLFTGFVSALISYQWGLGLYGQVFPAVGLLIVVALLPVQMFASRWWLDRFNFGPFEWLWRSWTYGLFPPMKRRDVGM
jgi:uncharacterized protein